MLSHVYGLHLPLIVGDTTQPGLTVDQLLGYVRHYEQKAAAAEPAAGQEGVTGGGAGVARRSGRRR